MKITKHLIVHGRVQGVGFRESMCMQAERGGVTGWVRNRRDSTVEAMLHGLPEDVSGLVEWARRGPPAAHVTHVDVAEVAGEYASFEWRPTV